MLREPGGHFDAGVVVASSAALDSARTARLGFTTVIEGSPAHPMKRFIRELRRREVFGSAGLYIGICWILIEVGGVVLPAFDAPEWVFRGLIIVAFAGFPLMLLLAWFFDIHRRGISVQGDATDTIVAQLGERKTDFVVIGVLAVALSISLYFNLSEEPERVVASGVAAQTLVVTHIEGLESDPVLADALAWALSAALERSPSASLYSPIGQLNRHSRGTEAQSETSAWVLNGSAEVGGERYTLTVSGVDAASGEERFSVSETATSEAGLLQRVADLGDEVHEELGLARALNAELSIPPSTDAVRAFVQGRNAMNESDFNEAALFFSQAIEHDAEFGDARAQLAFAAASVGRIDEARTHWAGAQLATPAASHRQHLRNVARYHWEVERDATAAAEAYEELIAAYPADATARSDFASVAFRTLDFSTAVEQTRRALEIYPNSGPLWADRALYAMYTGDWVTVADAVERAAAGGETLRSLLPAAAAEMANGNHRSARELFANAEAGDNRELALADIDLFLGSTDAARERIQSSVESDSDDAIAAAKQILLAEAYAAQGQPGEAVAAAESALQRSDSNAVMASSALVLIRSGSADRAQSLADAMTVADTATTRAYGRLLQGLLLRAHERPTDAVFALRDATNTADLWLVRYELGKTYVSTGNFTEALDELTVAANRRGEAMSLFQDGLSTFRHLSELPYWMGRAQQGLNTRAAARASYESFLETQPEDAPLAQDARQRIAALD